MLTLILIASLLVAAAIVVAMVTVADIGRQRSALAALDRERHEVEEVFDRMTARKKAVAGTLNLHLAMRDEKVAQIKQLMEELKQLEEGGPDREIKIASGLRQKSIEDAFGEGD